MPLFKYTVKGDKTLREASAPSKEALIEMLRLSGEKYENIIDSSDYDMPPLSEEEMKRMGLDPNIEKLAREEEMKNKQNRNSSSNSETPAAPIYRSSQGVTLHEEQIQPDSETLFEQGTTTFMLKAGKLYVKNWKECEKKEYRIFRKNKNGNLIEITNSVVIEKLDWNEVPQKHK